MNDILLEKYIREKIFLIKEEVEYFQLSDKGPDNKGPTFGQVKAFAKMKKTITDMQNVGSFGTESFKIKPFKIALGFISHYTGVGLVKDALKKAGVNPEDFGADDQAIESALRSIEKAIGISFTSLSPVKILAKLYGPNSDAGFERIQVPGNVSKLIDDRIEKAFFEQLWKTILEKDDDEVIKEGWILGELYKFTQSQDEIKDAWDDVVDNTSN